MSASFRDMKILLVDDNPHMRTIISAILKGLGVRDMLEAPDGRRALEVLRQWTPDVIFVDFLMQPMDGVDFTRAIRASTDKTVCFLPIIMLTGHAHRHRVAEARDAGVTEFMVKPITAKAVIDRLQAVIYRPRPFIKADPYFGPDRRRISGPPPGQERRSDNAGQPDRPAGKVTEI